MVKDERVLYSNDTHSIRIQTPSNDDLIRDPALMAVVVVVDPKEGRGDVYLIATDEPRLHNPLRNPVGVVPEVCEGAGRTDRVDPRGMVYWLLRTKGFYWQSYPIE